MEHPLIGNLDNLTIEQLSEKSSDLQKKLGIAQRSGNNQLCHQLRMALESYQVKYQEKLRAQYSQQLSDAKVDTSKIDIQ